MKPRPGLRLTAYMLLFLVLTAFFTLAGYPTERLTDLANAQLAGITGNTLVVRQAAFSLPLSIRFGEVFFQGREDSLPLGQMRVTPAFSRILKGQWGIRGTLEGPWLESRVSLWPQEADWSVLVRDLTLRLSLLPDALSPPFELDGDLTGSLGLSTKDPGKGPWSGEGRFAAGPVRVSGGLLEPFGLSPVDLTELSLVFTVRDNLLEVKENSLEGDLSANVRGTVLLVPARLEASRLDLTLELRPGPENREKLRPIFTLLGARPGPDGSVTLRVRGTVARPSMTS